MSVQKPPSSRSANGAEAATATDQGLLLAAETGVQPGAGCSGGLYESVFTDGDPAKGCTSCTRPGGSRQHSSVVLNHRYKLFEILGVHSRELPGAEGLEQFCCFVSNRREPLLAFDCP